MAGTSSGDRTFEQLSDKTFQQVEYHIQEAQSLLRKEAQRLLQEKETFDTVAKKLEHVHFSPTIKLNVGGQIFTTGLQTLTKDAGSMLHAMFSGRFDTKPAEDGSYFIDRDGAYFRYILNYLRTGKLSLPDDKLVQKDVLEEARFYQIQGIIGELDPKHYSDSLILSSSQGEWLVNVHNNMFTKCTLLYRGTRDGWSSSMFHAMCDSFNGPTMVVIKSTGGYIFGGYTEKCWAGSGFKADPAAFLFSLVSPLTGTNPVETYHQIKATQNHQSAIYCNFHCGPTFGGPRVNTKNTTKAGFSFGATSATTSVFSDSSRAFGVKEGFGQTGLFGAQQQQPFKSGYTTDNNFGHDLAICSNPHTNNCTINLRHTFVCQSAETFMTGDQYFTVLEIEIFGLKI